MDHFVSYQFERWVRIGKEDRSPISERLGVQVGKRCLRQRSGVNGNLIEPTTKARFESRTVRQRNRWLRGSLRQQGMPIVISTGRYHRFAARWCGSVGWLMHNNFNHGYVVNTVRAMPR